MRPLLALALLLAAGCASPAATLPPGPDASVAEVGAWAWSERAPAPRVLAEAATATDDGRLVVVGGWTEAGGGSPLAWAYDAEADAWSQLPPYPLAVHHAMAAAVDGVVYVFGGAVTTAPLPGGLVGVGPRGWPHTPLAFKLEAGAAAWAPLAPLPAPRFAGAAAAGPDGRIYLVGGMGPDGHTDVVLAYDPAEDRYHEAPPLPTKRDHLSAFALGGEVLALAGRVLVEGGWDDLGAFEALDVANGTWRALAEAPVGAGGQAAGVVGAGLVALVGGERLEGAFTVYDAAHAYDPARDAWAPLPPMPVGLHGMAFGAYGGALYVLGGATEAALERGTWRLAADAPGAGEQTS